MKSLKESINEGSKTPNEWEIWSTKRSLNIGFGYNTEIIRNSLNIDLQVALHLIDKPNSRDEGLNGWHYEFDLLIKVPFKFTELLNMNLCKEEVSIDLTEPSSGELNKVLDDLIKYTCPEVKSQIAYQITEQIDRLCGENDITLHSSVKKNIRKQMDILLKTE